MLVVAIVLALAMSAVEAATGDVSAVHGLIQRLIPSQAHMFVRWSRW